MAKTFYYKLSQSSSIFYDAKNKLKVTKGVPGKTTEKSKQTLNAIRNGHIIEISESEYNSMLSSLPELTQKALKIELKKPNEQIITEEDNNEFENLKRDNLIARLDEFELTKKQRKEALALSDEDLELYVEKLEASTSEE